MKTNNTVKNLIIASGVALLLLIPFAFDDRAAAPAPKTVVLGFDGLDPELLHNYMNAGHLPHFSRLASHGSFVKLDTTTPPQSPVAWASFITGANPGKHNVFDFLTRDPKTYLPTLTITEIERPESYELAGYDISFSQPVIVGFRKGTPFWAIANENGVSTTALLIPVTFPPDESATMLSGMGVPDITGSNGVFTYYTTDVLTRTAAEGGKIEIVRINKGLIESTLFGPVNDLVDGSPVVTVPFAVTITGNTSATLTVNGRTIDLTVGQLTDWVPVQFTLAPLVTIDAMVRFMLRSTAPEFELYATPINFDPEDPALQISNPPDFSATLAATVGPYYTQGMPEDTWALTEERISDADFITLTHAIQIEREKIFFSQLQKLNSGILVGVFVSSDRISHMFWRYQDDQHPLHDKIDIDAVGDPILAVYQRMDHILGRTMEYVDDATTLLVLSDHGFSTFRRSVHINRWLIDHGYMTLKPGQRLGQPLFSSVDWSRTKAYALGLNGIYINVAGREQEGIVAPPDVPAIKAQIIANLINLTDGVDGPPVIRRIFDADHIYKGPYRANSPDLVIGYDRGYRGSWQTALGGAPEGLTEDNMQKWSGDHMVDPDLVPGVLLSNKKLGPGRFSIMDLAPTILSFYGLTGDDMDGTVMPMSDK